MTPIVYCILTQPASLGLFLGFLDFASECLACKFLESPLCDLLLGGVSDEEAHHMLLEDGWGDQRNTATIDVIGFIKFRRGVELNTVEWALLALCEIECVLPE